MVRKLLAGVVLLASLTAVALVAGCGSSSSSSTGGSTGLSNTGAAVPGTAKATVIIKGYTFTPATLAVAKGTIVTWVNKDSVPHTVTMANGPGVDAQPVNQGINSGEIAPGASWSWQFVKQGTFFYMCTLHPSIAGMHAKVISGQAP
jgi:plastocyanin